ncbi:OmpA family protein [Stutzerimonas stutzeri]|uniref:OmpA family protein n=1 Tax=Stutzerimonas stutzeri TaxID=316 RepID=UPI0024497F5A|nr:OmpA family protein [Stutzerimonas stutzeri]MBW8337337.1 OmpA family protein [Pseudomonas sp.]MDH0058774.1 OmpA family protein [Stutzerimonas stutzeri]WQN28711.1 OmpA family protein [Stutzerimonas stutzeri]
MKSRDKGKAGEREVIVRRRTKKGHGDEHGGAWKVAFADFTLAMMALFMVLWIIQPQMNLTNPAFGEQESNPLVDGGAGIFDGTSTSPLELDGVPLRPAPDEPQRPREETARGEGETPEDGTLRYASTAELQALAALMQEVAGQVDALANLEVDVVPQGLRILIKDDQQRFMFQRGSAVLNPHFAKLLAVLAGVLSKVENKLIISGHTDATPYRLQSGYDNWNLSGDRALRARNVLVDAGLPGRSVLQVTAQADVMPLRPEAPEDGANRRVEILLLTDSAESLYKELFGDSYGKVRFSESGAQYSGQGGAGS